MSQENVEIVLRALDAWNEGDFDGWLETAHPDIEWVPALVQLMEGTQTTYQGISGLRRYWDDMHAIWDLSSEVAEARDLGNTVLVLGRILTTGGVGGVDVDAPWGFVATLEDGLITRARTYRSQEEDIEVVGPRE